MRPPDNCPRVTWFKVNEGVGGACAVVKSLDPNKRVKKVIPRDNEMQQQLEVPETAASKLMKKKKENKLEKIIILSYTNE